MSEKYTEKKMAKGIDPSRIILDDAGRFELDDEQLALVSGGMMKDVEVIRGTEGCSEDGDIIVIRGTSCS